MRARAEVVTSGLPRRHTTGKFSTMTKVQSACQPEAAWRVASTESQCQKVGTAVVSEFSSDDRETGNPVSWCILARVCPWSDCAAQPSRWTGVRGFDLVRRPPRT